MTDVQYKMVNGELVPLTPEEIAAREAESLAERQRETLATANNDLDMGKTMFEILND